MKKTYITPLVLRQSLLTETFMIVPSVVTGDNGIGDGDDDPGSEGDPDTKEREIAWGSLW